MPNLFERNVASADQRLVLLAPPQATVPAFFRNVPSDGSMRQTLLQDLQRLRGSVYLADGAIGEEQLGRDGCHRTPEDERAWHLLILDRHRVSACVWYLEHPNVRSIEELRVRTCPLAHDHDWRRIVRRAVEVELETARKHRLQYVELGGWAVAPHCRGTGEGLLLALAAYSMGRAFGGALGLTTATVRHGSSAILRRLGGASLVADGEAVPPYYDPRYDCDMELLRFDSRKPTAKYEVVINALRDRLSVVPVVSCPANEPVPVPDRAHAKAWRTISATGGAAA